MRYVLYFNKKSVPVVQTTVIMPPASSATPVITGAGAGLAASLAGIPLGNKAFKAADIWLNAAKRGDHGDLLKGAAEKLDYMVNGKVSAPYYPDKSLPERAAAVSGSFWDSTKQWGNNTWGKFKSLLGFEPEPAAPAAADAANTPVAPVAETLTANVNPVDPFAPVLPIVQYGVPVLMGTTGLIIGSKLGESIANKQAAAKLSAAQAAARM